MMNTAELSVASFNVHAGIDGWGRSFDVLRACESIDADVLVLLESWEQENRPPFAHEVAQHGGYVCIDAGFAPAVMLKRGPSLPPGARERWGPPFWSKRYPRVLSFTNKLRKARSSEELERLGYERVSGRWGFSLLCRLPIVHEEVSDLPRLRADRTDRKAVSVDVKVGNGEVRIVGTHLAHLEVGSLRQMRALHLRFGSTQAPTILCGDMNSWAFPLRAMLPGWRRAVKGATWPAWQPNSQIDHIFYRGPLEVTHGEVLTDFGSDHRPVRATFKLKAKVQHP